MAENMKTDGASAGADSSLLEQIITDSKVAHSDTEKTRAKELINQLVQEVMDGKINELTEHLQTAEMEDRLSELESDA